MKKIDSFHEFVIGDLLADIPDIMSRAMFGGFGLYKNGIIFAIIADGALYFKVNETNKSEYEKYGSKPFTYKMPTGKLYEMSYWLLPEEIMEDREELSAWVSTSVAASIADKKKKRGK